VPPKAPRSAATPAVTRRRVDPTEAPLAPRKPTKKGKKSGFFSRAQSAVASAGRGHTEAAVKKRKKQQRRKKQSAAWLKRYGGTDRDETNRR
jgi:hypothetical protein